MIDELEARGLVRRHESPSDRRSHARMLTPAGLELMPKLHATSEAHERRLIAAIGADRHALCLGAIAGLAAALDQQP